MWLKRKIVKILNGYKSGDFDYLKQVEFAEEGMEKESAVEYVDWWLYKRRMNKKLKLNRHLPINLYWRFRYCLYKDYYRKRRIDFTNAFDDCIKEGYLDKIKTERFIEGSPILPKERYLALRVSYVRVNKEGRKFIKWHRFTRKLLDELSFKQYLIILLSAIAICYGFGWITKETTIWIIELIIKR